VGYENQKQVESETMTKADMKPINLFATPSSNKELETWLESVRDPLATTGAMMMYNLIVSKYDLYEKKAK
jgi:hypothetical protein